MLEIRKDASYWVEHHLRNWADWQRGGGRPDALPGVASGGMCSEHSDFDDMCASMDIDHARITDAVIRDLSPAESCALHHKYLHAVYRFRDLLGVLAIAKLKVRAGLAKKGIWLG